MALVSYRSLQCTVTEDHACKHCFKNETITLQTGGRVTVWRMDFIE